MANNSNKTSKSLPRLSATQLKVVFDSLLAIYNKKRWDLDAIKAERSQAYRASGIFESKIKKSAKLKKQLSEDIFAFMEDRGFCSCSYNHYNGLPILRNSASAALFDEVVKDANAELDKLNAEFKAKYDTLDRLHNVAKLKLALASSYEEVAPLLKEFTDAKI